MLNCAIKKNEMSAEVSWWRENALSVQVKCIVGYLVSNTKCKMRRYWSARILCCITKPQICSFSGILVKQSIFIDNQTSHKILKQLFAFSGVTMSHHIISRTHTRIFENRLCVSKLLHIQPKKRFYHRHLSKSDKLLFSP